MRMQRLINSAATFVGRVTTIVTDPERQPRRDKKRRRKRGRGRYEDHVELSDEAIAASQELLARQGAQTDPTDDETISWQERRAHQMLSRIGRRTLPAPAEDESTSA